MTPIKISEAIWLEEIEDKIIRKHQVWPSEVEQTLLNQPHIRFMEQGHRPDENLYAAFDQTDGGRYLAVYFILKPANVALIITARDMTDKEKRAYGQR